MDNHFFALDSSDDVINLQGDHDTYFLSQPMFKLKDLVQKTKQNLLEISDREWNQNSSWITKRKEWLNEGMDCEILHLGDTQWKKGKIRVKITVEFCPDEVESPLDDIRKTLTENNP